MAAKAQPTAASISAFLRRAGWHPGQLNGREGVQVVNGYPGPRIRLQWDSDRRCAREQAEMVTVLREAGYKATPVGSWSIEVSR